LLKMWDQMNPTTFKNLSPRGHSQQGSFLRTMEWARFHLGTCECGAIALGGNALDEGLFQSVKHLKVFLLCLKAPPSMRARRSIWPKHLVVKRTVHIQKVLPCKKTLTYMLYAKEGLFEQVRKMAACPT
jgi:hypothetical protein